MGDLLGNEDGLVQGLSGCRSDVLDKSHPHRIFRAPVISGQHVAHSVSPSRLTDEANGSAAALNPAMTGFILTEARVSRSDADIDSKHELVCHIPGVAVHRDDHRL